MICVFNVWFWGETLRFSPLKVADILDFHFQNMFLISYFIDQKQLPNRHILLFTRKNNQCSLFPRFLHRKIAYSKLKYSVINNSKKLKRTQIHPRASDWLNTLEYIYTVGYLHITFWKSVLEKFLSSIVKWTKTDNKRIFQNAGLTNDFFLWIFLVSRAHHFVNRKLNYL